MVGNGHIKIKTKMNKQNETTQNRQTQTRAKQTQHIKQKHGETHI